MFDVSRLIIIFKISYLFSFFIITKWLQEERAGKYTPNFVIIVDKTVHKRKWKFSIRTLKKYNWCENHQDRHPFHASIHIIAV